MINCAHPEECGGWEMRSVIPNEEFEVFEKMDGSLGILFYYNDEWILATKGSFTSDQSIKGMEIFKRQEDKYGSNLSTYNTYLCEIIYPENRIVVDYGNEEKLVLLGIINNLGAELPHNQFIFEWHSPELIVKRYDGISDYKQLKTMVKDNQEGFIIRFKSGMRMKIKGEEYVRLHRLLTNFSNVDIWEALKRGDNMNEMLERVPDEFDLWVKKTIKDLRYAHYQISEHCGKIHDYFRYGKYNDVDPEPTRKQFAEFVMNNVKEKNLHGVLFAMWDKNRDKYNDIIWKLIRPEYQKPFWQTKEV
jgi:RNA ligase